ncbi:major intrinsically disordered NOTCH2-binding receptor 1-like [Emydura macquarii macquarii]|uniref:major intrinsically disordered NOTCH2-binding receptor 1-like n=1 Tax=Emydura macquarii macquarii TaxID=1129001 RepID=UPI00352AC5E7
MDFSVLPNNNHPDKFLQLDVKSLVKKTAFLQASLAKYPEAVFPGAQQWHNKVYLQHWATPMEPTVTAWQLLRHHKGPSSLCAPQPTSNAKGSRKWTPHPCPEDKPPALQFSCSLWAYFPHHHFVQREKNCVFEQPGLELSGVSPAMIDRALGKHITTVTLKSTIKSNPLYADIRTDADWEERKRKPSWTVQDYDKHSLHSNLAHYLKENPNDLQFWMGDIYTPGYDTLLKKKEREKKRSKCCLIILLVVLAVCILIAIVTVCILFT